VAEEQLIAPQIASSRENGLPGHEHGLVSELLFLDLLLEMILHGSNRVCL
jgi:hypothetical protein